MNWGFFENGFEVSFEDMKLFNIDVNEEREYVFVNYRWGVFGV